MEFAEATRQPATFTWRNVVTLQLSLNKDKTWSLHDWAKWPAVHGTYARLIDALYERERHDSGAKPPFGRWVVYGAEEVEPIRFDDESDEDMQSAEALEKTLHLREWEYEELLDYATTVGLRKEFAEIERNADGTWSLKSVGYSLLDRKPFERLIDAIYERQTIEMGIAPPYGRWLVCSHDHTEVEPLRFHGESDEQMQSATTAEKTLRLREWEYRQLFVDIALSQKKSSADASPDESW